MSLPAEKIPEHIKQFKLELMQLCDRFGISEIVTLAEYNESYTFIAQASNSGFSNSTFNAIEISIRAILEEINDKLKTQNNG